MTETDPTRTESEPTFTRDFTDRTHKAGGFLLMLAGIIGAIVGLALLFSASVSSDFLGGISPVASAGAGVIVLVFSLIEFGGGVAAYRGSNWYGSMTAAILGMVTFFTLPLDLVGTILIALGEGRFKD